MSIFCNFIYFLSNRETTNFPNVQNQSPIKSNNNCSQSQSMWTHSKTTNTWRRRFIRCERQPQHSKTICGSPNQKKKKTATETEHIKETEPKKGKKEKWKVKWNAPPIRYRYSHTNTHTHARVRTTRYNFLIRARDATDVVNVVDGKRKDGRKNCGERMRESANVWAKEKWIDQRSSTSSLLKNRVGRAKETGSVFNGTNTDARKSQWLNTAIDTLASPRHSHPASAEFTHCDAVPFFYVLRFLPLIYLFWPHTARCRGDGRRQSTPQHQHQRRAWKRNENM